MQAAARVLRPYACVWGMRRLVSRHAAHAIADALIWSTVRLIVWAVELEDYGESGAFRDTGEGG